MDRVNEMFQIKSQYCRFPEFPKKLGHFPLFSKGALPKISPGASPPDPPSPASLVHLLLPKIRLVDLSYSQIYPWIRS